MPTHGTPAWGAARRRLVTAATHANAHPNLTAVERDMVALVLRNPDAVLARPLDLFDVSAALAEIATRRRG